LKANPTVKTLPPKSAILISAVFLCAALVPVAGAGRSAFGVFHTNPYDWQVADQLSKLASPSPSVRAGAAEALGFMRAYRAADELARALDDPSAAVRRQAVMALAWCGRRQQIPPLLDALDDADWVVAQGAWAALCNLTGMEFPFDALAEAHLRRAQADVWRRWWAGLPADGVPQDILDLLKGARLIDKANLAYGCDVNVSSLYKGPAAVLTDGATKGRFWQTKNVAFPQQCTIDLRRIRNIGCVVVHQYGRGFCMTDYALSISTDGESYRQILRQKRRSSPRLVINFDPRPARYIRITSYAAERAIYPTTFFEVEVFQKTPTGRASGDSSMVKVIRGVRALGAWGGDDAIDALMAVLDPYIKAQPDDTYARFMVQSALRSLARIGRNRCGDVLIGFLDNPLWARYAADALGDCPSDKACRALLKAYPLYARGVNRSNPKMVPADDIPRLEPADRMYETPYAIALALCRMPWTDAGNLAELQRLVPLLAANIPSDFDGAMLYEPEAHQLITAWLMEKAQMRRMVADAALEALGVGTSRDYDSDVYPALVKLAKQNPGDIPFAAPWISSLCSDRADVPVLIGLLRHDNGWVRINAAKALMFIGDRRALKPIANLLFESRPEADFGFFGGFLFKKNDKQGQDEYEAKPPRWRVAFVRAIGGFGAVEYVDDLIGIMNDDRNVVEVQHAAAVALDELGTADAVYALKAACRSHPFYSIRLVAAEALWKRGLPADTRTPGETAGNTRMLKSPLSAPSPKEPPAYVFIKGDNDMPNDFQIDIWRQTYSTTDSGPTYRIGDNLYILSPPGPDGAVRQLTHFEDGYVADCEVSWDARQIVFCRRGGMNDPWWHIYRINVDGTNLTQLTDGPYHDVQPAWLGDGRIVFSSSRIGMRDEYHGYLSTGLTVMNADGSDMHCIGFNLGRDNEPSVMPDGRILFSRLELFYSRLKTELTVHAVFPDGTKDLTLYGPEHREFWRRVSARSGEKWWAEAPPRHRILRLTQPHYLGDGRIVCATTGGIAVIGPGKMHHRLLPRDRNMAATRVLCAASVRDFDRSRVDLGIYIADIETGRLQLV